MKATILAALGLLCACSNTPRLSEALHELGAEAPSCTCTFVIVDGEGKLLKKLPPAGE